MTSHSNTQKKRFRASALLLGIVLLLAISMIAAQDEAGVPGYMDNFRKIISGPSDLVAFLLSARLSEDFEAAAQRIPKSLGRIGLFLTEKYGGVGIRLGGKIVPSGHHTFWKHYETPDQRPWIDILRFENEEACNTFFLQKDQWHSGAPRADSFLFFTVNNTEGLDAVSVIVKRDLTIFNFGVDIPFKILMPKEGENSPEQRQYVSDSIDSLLLTMEAVARALVDPEVLTWIPPALPDPEDIRVMRLAAFSRLWSEVKYNFVFLDQRPKLDWDRLLEFYLAKIDAAGSQDEYTSILREAVALLQDGHSWVGGGGVPDGPLLNIEPVEGRPVVTAIGDTPEMQAGPVRPGMELIAVEGVPVGDILEKEIYPYIFASTRQDRDRKAFGRLLGGESGSSIAVTFLDMDDTVHEVTLVRSLNQNRDAAPWMRSPAPLEYKELEDGIVYVALNTFGSDRVVKAFDARFGRIAEADALVIDVRKNGGGSTDYGYSIIARLIQEPIAETPSWRSRQLISVHKAWGREQEWYEGDHGIIESRGETPFLKPVVVLIGPNTYSAAEDFLIPLKASGRATLIGEATGGSTGQPLLFDVYGARVSICVKWDRFPDGTDFVGVGVLPDIEVPMTKNDVRRGSDPVLERALSFLRSK